MTRKDTGRDGRNWLRLLVTATAAVLLSGHADLTAQAVLDLCGCAGDPGLQPFVASNQATWPAGTTCSSNPCTSGTLILTPPPDGVFKFSSFTVDGAISIVAFNRNAANTPITILVAGDVLIRNNSFCCTDFTVSGGNGSGGTAVSIGIGGGSGNGGFRGGDGSGQGINGSTIGGAGFGPGGGAGGSGSTASQGGSFIGVPELLPILGGSGGGGGGSFGATANCTGGGGGGGGGALLIAANGQMNLTNTDVTAQGGSGSSVGNGACATGGSGGSAGAIRLVARTMITQGAGRLWAQGGAASFNSVAGANGRIRLESVDLSAQTVYQAFGPAAIRITGPGPVSSPITPSVRITSVGGTAVPVPTLGHLGNIDITLPVPAVTSVDFTTSGVPSGTTVEVKVKPRFGALPQSALVPLANCDGLGACTATTSFNLAAGAHVVEARATFQVP